MHKKPQISAIAVSIAALMILSACGGGDHRKPLIPPVVPPGSEAPATFAVPEDGAKAAAAVVGLARLSVTGVAHSVTTDAGTSNAKSMTTTDCDIGHRTFTTDNTTAFAEDGRDDFFDCTLITKDQNQVETGRLIKNGVRAFKCYATNPATVCIDDGFTVGEGSVPFSQESKSDSKDLLTKVLESGWESLNGVLLSQLKSGSESFENLANQKSGVVNFDQFTITTLNRDADPENINVSGQLDINDLARSTANCISGKMRLGDSHAVSDGNGSSHVTGNTSFLLLDRNTGNSKGGQLHFSSTDGTFADVTFDPNHLGDDRVVVVLNGDQDHQTIFTAAEFSSFCSVD